MNFGIFLNGMEKNEAIINRSAYNIANINTTAFKSINAITNSVDFSVSAFLFTGNKLDLSISSSNSFFKLVDGEGNNFYTRNGKFSLNNQGEIVDSNGYKLDTNFTLDPSKSFAIKNNGCFSRWEANR